MAKAIDNCPIDHTLQQIAGKWKGPIIMMLLEHPNCRFNKLLPACSRRMLALQLKELVAARIIAKKVTGTVPVQTSYSLTPRGRQLRPVIEGMQKWGQQG